MLIIGYNHKGSRVKLRKIPRTTEGFFNFSLLSISRDVSISVVRSCIHEDSVCQRILIIRPPEEKERLTRE